MWSKVEVELSTIRRRLLALTEAVETLGLLANKTQLEALRLNAMRQDIVQQRGALEALAPQATAAQVAEIIDLTRGLQQLSDRIGVAG